MKQTFRVLVALVVAVSTYYLIYWVPFAFIPLGEQRWVASLVSLLCAVGLGRYVWVRSGSAPDSLVSHISYGAVLLGGIGFSAGFFGPLIFAPEANQGPLLGIFITGPLGFLFGGVGGLMYWLIRRRRAQPS